MPQKPRLGCLVVICAVVAVIVLWPRPRGEKPKSQTPNPRETPGAKEPITVATRETTLPAKAGTPYTERFAAWTETFLNTPAAEQSADLMIQGAELVRDRRAEMAQLIKKN